ncbi:MAG TPA: MFS transporter [Ardenticatenaceae bacterium]|nr:MFS transporter [Ardenticatenaceae bacterium]
MKKWDAYVVYLTMTALGSLAFSLVVTVNLVYQATVAGLNPLQLVLVGTLLEATAFLGEVPTGVIADVYSRRLSIIIGVFLTGLGFLVEGSFPLFGAILLAQVIWGLGATFPSGAEQAWIADEIGEERVGHAFLRASQVGQLAGLVGIAASVMLASIRINLPILIGGALFVVEAIFLVLVMPERGFRAAPGQARSSWQQMGATLRGGIRLVRVRPVLLTLLAISAIHGMFSEGFDRLWTPHVLANFTFPALGNFEPVIWFGIIQAVGMLISIGANEVARRRVDTTGHHTVARALFAIYALTVATVVVFGLAGNFGLALVAFWATGALRSTSGPLFNAWLNQNLDSSVRATVFSMTAQSNAIGQIAGGPILGVVGTFVSLRAALVAAGLALAPSLPLYARTIRVTPKTAEVEATLPATPPG